MTPGAAIYRETIEALKELRLPTAGKPATGKAVPSLSNADVAQLRKIARRHQQASNCLARIRRGHRPGEFEHERGHYLDAFSTRVCATVRAFAKTHRRGTLTSIYRSAHDLDVCEVLSEPVRVRMQPKPKGGYRPIMTCGPRRIAQQYIMRDVLTAVGIDNDLDYARRGAGGEKAMIGEICRRIDDGYGHWQTLDIVKCYASLEPAHLDWLPLSDKLIRNVVFLPGCARIRIATRAARGQYPAATHGSDIGAVLPSALLRMEALTATTMEARQGLPQGSILSPSVARAFVGRELRAVLGKTEVFCSCWVDNLTLGARSHPKLEQAFEALRARLAGHPAGPIHLHIDQPTSAKKGRVNTHGYVLEPGRGYGSNSVHVRPGHERFERFHRRIYDAWVADGPPDELENYVLEKLLRWMPSQQAWTPIPLYSLDHALTFAVLYLSARDLGEFKASQTL